MSGIETKTDRSYSPQVPTKLLNEEDPDEFFVERIDEMGLEMGMAMNYMKEMGNFLTVKEDMKILENCEDMVHDAVDTHLDLI